MPINADQIIRSNRRTLALHITKDAQLIVRAPHLLPMKMIQNFIAEKQQWIVQKQQLAHTYYKQPPAKQFIDDEKFWYLGNIYRLRLTDNKKITLTDYLYFPKKFLPNPKRALINWYKAQAHKIITDRVHIYAIATGLHPGIIKITSANRRWGSCSRNNINFSWRLVMTPIHIIDYVVIHELVHIQIKNHSVKFWRQVEKFFPEYKCARIWLRENSRDLLI